MRKLLALLSTALLAATATAAAAAADPPGNPVVNEPFALPAAPFCGFDVNVDVLANKERSTTTTLADGTIVTRVTGKLVESYTNADSGKTIVRDVSGATTTTARPDGTATFVGTGDNRLIFGPTSRKNTGEPALAITSGQVIVNFTGNIATGFSLSRRRGRGRQENVCDLLAAA